MSVTFSLRRGEDTRPVSADWYNDINQIRSNLTDLSSLWKLFEIRKKAGIYGRDERLSTFVIYGRIVLMNDGNYGLRQAKPHAHYPDIVEGENLGEELGMIGMCPALPWPTDTSAISGVPWTIENAYDFMLFRGDDDSRICYTIKEYEVKRSLEVLSQFEAAFQNAGISDNVSFSPKTNKYWGSNVYMGPWYDVVTELGTLTIGWRKRVVECTFAPSWPIRCDELIKDNVTKSSHLFHAYSYEDLTSYLQLVREQATKNISGN